MSHHIPVEKICEKLKKKDSQICELKYGELPGGENGCTFLGYCITVGKSMLTSWRSAAWVVAQAGLLSVNILHSCMGMLRWGCWLLTPLAPAEPLLDLPGASSAVLKALLE